MGGKQLVGFIHGVAVLNPVDQQCIPLYLGIQGGAAADTQRLLAVVGGQAHVDKRLKSIYSPQTYKLCGITFIEDAVVPKVEVDKLVLKKNVRPF